MTSKPQRKCEPGNMVYLSNPPQYKCIHCGQFWWQGDLVPNCRSNTSSTPEPKGWEMEFFNRFGANKIWVTPSRDNVETVLEIHAFISQTITEAIEEGYKKGRDDEAKECLGHPNKINTFIKNS